jgi:hypothetical protein
MDIPHTGATPQTPKVHDVQLELNSLRRSNSNEPMIRTSHPVRIVRTPSPTPTEVEALGEKKRKREFTWKTARRFLTSFSYNFVSSDGCDSALQHTRAHHCDRDADDRVL